MIDAWEETEDPEADLEDHPADEILSGYPERFRNWVNHLLGMTDLQEAGYPFSGEDLSLDDWKGIRVIKIWREEKRNAEESG